MEGEAKKFALFSTMSLTTNGFHSHGEAGEDGVAGDVGEADGEGAAGERKLAETAKKKHRDQRAGI